MKRFILASVLVLTSSVFASEMTLNCKQVLNGNYNSKAHTVVKSLDLVVKFDLDKKDASINGSGTLKSGKYQYENDIIQIYSYFTDNRTFSKKGPNLEITSKEKGDIFCGGSSGTGPCRKWNKLVINFNTGEALYERSYSNSRVFGEIVDELSFKMLCKTK